MLGILAEGVRDVVLPCSAVLWVPGLAVAVAGRGRLAVAAAYVVGAATTVAARFVLAVEPSTIGWLGPVLGVVLLLGVLALRPPGAATHQGLAVLGAGLVGGAVALVWRPCVGRELGAAFNMLGDQPAQAGARLLLYVVGLTATTWLAALLAGARRTEASDRLGAIASGLVGLLGVVVLVGVADDVVGTLVRWSL